MLDLDGDGGIGAAEFCEAANRMVRPGLPGPRAHHSPNDECSQCNFASACAANK